MYVLGPGFPRDDRDIIIDEILEPWLEQGDGKLQQGDDAELDQNEEQLTMEVENEVQDPTDPDYLPLEAVRRDRQIREDRSEHNQPTTSISQDRGKRTERGRGRRQGRGRGRPRRQPVQHLSHKRYGQRSKSLFLQIWNGIQTPFQGLHLK